MGKPMKNRILSIALALSMLAVVFYAFAANASVIYTGSVQTTDNTGAPKTIFFQGDQVYMNVQLNNDLGPYSGTVQIQLVRTTDGTVLSTMNRVTNNPDVGWYNSSVAGSSFGTWNVFPGGFQGDMITCDVVASYLGTVIGRQSITVEMTGLTLSPASSPGNPYYPGQHVSITMVTTQLGSGFYMQIVNSTGDTILNVTNQVTWTGWWNYDWTVASDFPDGQFTVNIRDFTSNAVWYTDDIWVQKYVLRVSSDRTYYLIGETAQINYAVFDASLGTPYSGVTVTYSATYRNLTGNQTWVNNTPPLTGSAGTQLFTITSDVNLSSNVVITYWANETGTSRSYTTTLTLYTGILSATVSVNAGPYLPGDLVAVTINAKAGTSNLPGASVALTVERNGTPIVAYGATNLTTDALGGVTHTFWLDSASQQGSYVVNVTVTKLGQTVNRLGTFVVTWSGALMVTLDKTSYYGGDTINVHFRTIWNGVEMDGLQVAYYATVSYGILLTGNTTTGDAQVAVPAGYYGSLSISASVNVNGNIFDGYASTTVNIANIVLTTDKSNYRQGDVITFNYEIVTSVTTATLQYEITDASGVTVGTGSPAFSKAGSFEYTVPSAHPSTSYTARMVMTTDAGGYLTSSLTVSIMDNYELQLWLGPSGYVSGEYKPGQTVKLHYTINTYAANLPVYKIVVTTNLDPVPQTYLVTATSGVLDYKIPSNAPTSLAFMYGELYNGVSGASLYDTNQMLFSVNSQLGAWDSSVAGMSAINFTLLVLVIIMILLLIIVPFLKGRMGGEKPAATKAPEPVPPPSP